MPRFIKETGYTRDKYSDKEVAERLILWTIANPKVFGVAAWRTPSGYLSIDKNSPLRAYEDEHLWDSGTGGNCGILSEYQVIMLMALGVHARTAVAYLVKTNFVISPTHGVTLFLDAAAGKWRACDFQNNCLFLGEANFFDNPADLYAGTGAIISAIGTFPYLEVTGLETFANREVLEYISCSYSYDMNALMEEQLYYGNEIERLEDLLAMRKSDLETANLNIKEAERLGGIKGRFYSEAEITR